MKKTIFPIVLVSALLTIFSCGKSFDAKEEGLIDSTEAMTFTATIESGDTKTTLDGNKVKWKKGDQITIIDNNGNGNGGVYTANPNDDNQTKATFSFANQGTEASASNYIAYYPSSICWKDNSKTVPTLPAIQTCDGTFALNPMYAYSENQSLAFKNICSILELKTDLANVTKIELSTTDENLSGTFTINNAENYKMTMTGTTANDKKVSLNVTNAPDAVEGYYYYYIAIPAQAYTTLTINVTANGSTRTMTKKIESALERNTIYTLTFKQDLALKGVFSISETKKVKFSPGNLWSNGASNPVLHFEENQWSTKPSANVNWDYTHVSHFYWTNDVSRADDESSDYYEGYDFFAKEGNTLTIDGESGWYALNQEEWNYLINTRTMTGGMTERYYWTYVKSITGLVIFPDDYPSSLGTEASWEQMEAAGCVFLPTAGFRERTSVSLVDSEGAGFYWSSTSNNKDLANYLFFGNPDQIGFDIKMDVSFRYGARSLRLVQEHK